MKNNKVIILIILALILVCGCFCLSKSNLLENFHIPLGKCHKLDELICSPNCTHSQWPTSVPITHDPRIDPKDIGKKWIPTSYTCSGKYGQGFVCVNKNAHELLRHRGNNAL